MKVCTREDGRILASGGPDVYRLSGGEVVILPEPEVSVHAHEPIEVK